MNKSKYVNSPNYRAAKRDLIIHYSLAGALLVIGLVALALS